MDFGSLFSGIGGLDLGLERAGMRCVWQVECDEFCRGVLERHWPTVPRHDDIRTFEPTTQGGYGCDLIAGGFPCKQTSTAAAVHGRRLGLAGEDSGLWFDMLRVVGKLLPRWVVVENTGGVQTWAATITTGLEGLGYTVSRPVLSAAGVGAPHLRRRVFFVANADGKRLEIAGAGRSSEAGSEPWRAADGNPWLSALSGLLRVADGLPAGMDRKARIVALGNAVVPAVGECLGRAIIECDIASNKENHP